MQPVLAARLWWFEIHQQGKLGQLAQKPWRPRSEWAQVSTASHPSHLHKGCKEIWPWGCTNWFGPEAIQTIADKLTFPENKVEASCLASLWQCTQALMAMHDYKIGHQLCHDHICIDGPVWHCNQKDAFFGLAWICFQDICTTNVPTQIIQGKEAFVKACNSHFFSTMPTIQE